MTIRRPACYLPLLICGLAGCSETSTAPSPSALINSGLVVPAPPTGSGPGAPGTHPWDLVGPTDVCLERPEIDAMPAHELTWEFIVRDAGARGMTRFLTYAYHDDTAGCDPTIANLRMDRIRQTAGMANYRPHGEGMTYFAAPLNEWTCGRGQMDIAFDDGVGLTEFVRLRLNYGHDCTPPPSTCVDRHDALAGPADWVRTSTGSVETSFTVNPRLAGPIHLSIVSREIVIPGQILPQRFVAMRDGTFAPGQRVDNWTIQAAACPTAQIDIVTCESPTGDLTAGNFDEQDRRTVSWFVDASACR